jgi:formylmethanofuran dehydrogenase subunit E
MESIELRAIGIVHNGISAYHGFPRAGVPATIEIFDRYIPGILGIERSSHIMIIGWLHQADRHLLQVHRPRYVDAEVKRGVFACRTPVRPNPLGTTTVRLIKVEGNLLHVDGLDMADGTPVLDIKPHAPGFDAAFCARSARDLSRLADPDAEHALQSMLREAENFHGERCVGLVLGTKMLYHVMKTFGVAQKDPAVVISLGEKQGCAADAVQALSGATFGNGRLEVNSGSEFAFCHGNRNIVFELLTLGDEFPEEWLKADIADMCVVVENEDKRTNNRQYSRRI